MCAAAKYNSFLLLFLNKIFATAAPTMNFRATIVTLWERHMFVYGKILLYWPPLCPKRSFFLCVLGVKLLRRPWKLPDYTSGDWRECVCVDIKVPLTHVSYSTPPLLHQLQGTDAESVQHIFPTSQTFLNGPRVFERTPLSLVSATSWPQGKHYFWFYKESQKNYLEKIKQKERLLLIF